MSGRKARLMLSTLRHLRPWQVFGRIYARVKPFTAARTIPEDLRGSLAPRAHLSFHDPWNSADDLRRGRFHFLNHTVDLSADIDWHPSSPPLLWQFNLHYFNFLHLLDRSEQQLLCRSWVEANEPGGQPGWHPYPTSLRIANWCKCEISDPVLLRSLYLQASFLVRNLETHVYGNHLLENARALVLAGRFLSRHGEASRWLRKGYDIYRSELPEQILPDGMHFEKSPMYHALMLDNLLDVISVTPEDEPDSAYLTDWASRMTAALPAVVHPDGHVALFNDSTIEIAPPPASILGRAQQLGVEAEPRMELPSSGYYVLENRDLRIIADAGSIGPSYLTAHSHADTLSYEMSVSGVTIVTDTGVMEYQEGKARDYDRSTRAHNTVTVDGTNQAECWSNFRVGRRFAPVDVERRSGNGAEELKGCYPGYEVLIGDGIRHERQISVFKGSRASIIDIVSGSGEHLVESAVHLHPETEITEHADGFLLSRDGAACVFSCSTPYLVEDRPYSPRFGLRLMRPAIVIRVRTDLPIKITYEFRTP